MTARRANRRPGALVLALVAVLAAGAAPARAQGIEALAGRTVTALTLVSGGQPLADPQIESLIEIRKGAPLTMALVRETIIHVMSMGRFLDVRVEAEPDGEGAAVVVEVVRLREVRRVLFRGELGLPERALRDVVTNRFGASPALGRAGDIARTVEERLQGAGFLRAVVTPRPLGGPDSAAGDLVFDVACGTQARLSSLEYRGSPDEVVAELGARLELKAGSVYMPADLGARLEAFAEAMRSRGYFEASARPSPRVSEDGLAVDLLITVTRGPLVSVQFTGDALTPKQQAELVPVQREGSADQDLLEDSELRIRDFLRSQGYRDAKATFARAEEDGVLKIVFTVTRGPLYRVASVPPLATAAIADAELRRQLRTAAGEPFVQATLDADLAVIRAEYRSRGFASASITAEVVPVPGGGAAGEIPVAVTISAVEGPRTTVRQVAVAGASVVAESQLLSILQTRANGPLFGPTIDADRDRILTEYLNRGYNQATVDASIIYDADPSTAVVRFAVREGVQIIVDHVLVVGNDRISESTIRQEITLAPGEPLALDRMNETQRRLAALGLFRRVTISELQHGGAGRCDVLITVEEAPATTIGFGGGVEFQKVETAEFAPRGFFEVGRRNLWGKNRSINFFSRVSLRQRSETADTADPSESVTGSQTDLEYRVTGAYREPRVFGTTADLQTAISFEQGSRTSYAYRHRSARVDLARRFGSQWSFLGQYSIQRNDIFEDRINPEDRPLIDRLFPQVRIGSVSTSVAHDTRDDILDPGRGGLISLNGELALRPLGSEVGFAKTFLQAFVYRRMPTARRLVLAGGARLGLATGFPRSVEQTDENGDPILGPDGQPVTVEVRDIPASERFFAGGDTSVRGFQLDRLGRPDTFDSDGTPIGGHAEIILNGEARLALWRDVGVVGFVDLGNVFSVVNDVSLGKLRAGAGFGIRYKSPVGPIRVDFGYKLGALQTYGTEKEHRFALHISIGQAF